MNSIRPRPTPTANPLGADAGSRDARYRAVASRDRRFDGQFVTAVRTTGICCRPSCPARTPAAHNVEFFPSFAAATLAGYRACRRCRPDATPGTPGWDQRSDTATRALALIADGVVERDGVCGLAQRLGYSARQLNRVLVAECGAGPLALARVERARLARTLLESSEMSAAEVAFAAGFSSVRQFNDTIRQVYGCTPTTLRRAQPGRCGQSCRSEQSGYSSQPGRLTVRLSYREPISFGALRDFLAARAIDGVERVVRGDEGAVGAYSRTLRLPHGIGLATIRPRPGWIETSFRLGDTRDLRAGISRMRRLLDLDADPVAIDEVLGAHPALAPLVAARPGLRAAGAVDGFEILVRALVGQQISVAGARTILARLTREFGEHIGGGGEDSASRDDWWLFPTPSALAAADPDRLPMPRARGRTLVAAAQAVDAGTLVLDAGADPAECEESLVGMAGIGRWTATYVRMRVLGEPDLLLESDLGVRRVAASIGFELAAASECVPWRSYLTHHLWAAAGGPLRPSPKRQKALV